MKWIKKGLSFTCHQCGNCCTGSPGYVWVDEHEMKNLAKELDISFDEFTRRYIRKVKDSYSLIEKSNNDCIFWDKKDGCRVYSARPQQCRTYPFWPEILKNRSSWLEESKECLGICESLAGNGKFHSLEKIKNEMETAKRHDPEQS